MPEFKHPLDIESETFDAFLVDNDIFDHIETITDYQNQRKSVRYVRKDVTAFISQPDIFGTYSLFSYSQAIRIKLLDISSRGALIGGPSKLTLKIKQKVLLTLIFNSNKKFEISARVMHQLEKGRRFYGIQFNKTNDELGDYLLESQPDFRFK